MTVTPRSALPPGGMIGILGGGQLGRMLALAAARLGLRTHIYSDVQDAPAFDVATKRTCAKYDDSQAFLSFAQTVDVITFEFENVPSATVAVLAHQKPTFPRAEALAIAQDRVVEKDFLEGLGVPTTAYASAESLPEARDAIKRTGLPAVVKTTRFGYDGKGQWMIAGADDLVPLFSRLKGTRVIVERRVEFAFECSVVAVRSETGEFAAYDPSENIHREHILREAIVPAPLTARQSGEAKRITARIAQALEYVGVLAVEFFLTRDGRLLVNEIAPRVHNSGHWTLEACIVSQFEQHIRAVAGWPLGDTRRHSNAVMVNLIGAESDDWQKLAREPVALHLYGKNESRSGRKMGHFTRLSPLGVAPGRD